MPFDAPIHANEPNLPRVLSAGLPLLLVFWRRDCAPCSQLGPILDRLARSYAGRALIVKVDAGAETGLVRRYNVTRLPTLLFIKEGQTLATAVGAADEPQLVAWLDHLTRGGPRPPVPGGPSIPVEGPAVQEQPRGDTSGEPQRPPREAAGRPVVVTDATFESVLRSSRTMPVLVDFWAEWCGPCKMIAPAVAELAREFAGRAVVAKLNVDENPRTAGRYGIMSIPTLLIFRNGQVVDQVVGAQPAHVLRQRLMRQLG